VLFCDLVGSTPLSQQLDAEEWRDLIAQYQQAVSGAVGRFGGHVARKLGDGLLIYFGWPTAREDDPERAVRAALAIVDAMEPLNAALAAGDGPRLTVRIGLHTGPVVIADDGEVFGETPNVAARVQGAAEPDTVVVTAATQRLVAGMFVVEDRGPQRLTGVREPVTLYRVVQPSGVRSRLAVAAGRLTRFVGREIELATLVERWGRARDGEGHTVVVLGGAGGREIPPRLPVSRAPDGDAPYLAGVRRDAVHGALLGASMSMRARPPPGSRKPCGYSPSEQDRPSGQGSRSAAETSKRRFRQPVRLWFLSPRPATMPDSPALDVLARPH
jgi:class 3 adenylate cyclase